MFYDDLDLWQIIQNAVSTALSKNPASSKEITDLIFVQIKKIVHDEQKEYTIAQLRELLTSL